MKSVSGMLLLLILLVLLHAAPAVGAHKDCQDYCGGDLNCYANIERYHDETGACSNYGFGSVASEGSYCRLATEGLRPRTIGTQSCTLMGGALTCVASSTIRCHQKSTGNTITHYPTQTCPQRTANGHTYLPEQRVYPDRITCDYADGASTWIFCDVTGSGNLETTTVNPF